MNSNQTETSLKIRPRYIWLFSIVFSSLAGAASNSFAQSFDCRAATHISDKMICRDVDLSALEESYVTAYQTVVSRGGSDAETAKSIAARQMTARRRCDGDLYCIRDVLTDTHTSLDAIIETYWDEPEPDEITSPEALSWKQLEALSVDELISLWFRMNSSCRGGSTLMHLEDCSTREEVSDYLTRMRGWCYGREGEAGVDHEWHECGTTSVEEIAGREWDTVIRLWGETNDETVGRFMREADQATGRVIVSLAGPGGFVDPGLEIAKVIQDRGFATVVEPGKQCASICAVMFLSSENRFMSRFGTVDVHSVYQRDSVSGNSHRSFSGNEDVADTLRRGGVPRDVIYYVQSGDPDWFYPISPDIARNMGLDFTEF